MQNQWTIANMSFHSLVDAMSDALVNGVNITQVQVELDLAHQTLIKANAVAKHSLGAAELLNQFNNELAEARSTLNLALYRHQMVLAVPTPAVAVEVAEKPVQHA